MKKTTYLLSILLLTLISCGERTSFTLKGNISGLKSDTLLVYYQLPKYKLDTIITDKGKFDYTISPDTFTIFSLIFDSQHSYPIYADKGEKVELNGTIDNLIVKGKGDNQALANILTTIADVPSHSIRQKVDSIIKNNAYSFTNIYLIDKYYTQDSLPDITKIKELITGMGGIIRETPYMMNLLAKIEHLAEKDKNRSIYSLVNKDRKGQNLHWASIRNKYILIDFWASWDKESVAAQDSLIPVLKALKNEKFQVISLSLDLDKEAWLAASDRDTTQWLQLCDFTGWNNKLVKDQSIHTLPSNILLDTNKRIIERDIRGQKLIDKVKELIKRDKEREKARKEAERKRKKKK